jgi:MacB-like periplasmic core domain
MLATSRAWSVASVLAVVAGLCANPVTVGVAEHLFQNPTYPDSTPLVMLDPDSIRFGLDGIPQATVTYLQDHARSSFEGIFPVQPWHLSGGLQAERIPVAMMDAVGAKPWRGRTLLEDDLRGVVVSYDFAGGDENWVGREILLASGRYKIVGIMQPGFRLLAPDAQIWAVGGTGAGNVQVAAKLKPGVGIEKAQAELRRVSADLKQYRLRNLQLMTLRENRFRNLRFALEMLKWNLAFVLFVALGGLARFLLQLKRSVNLKQHIFFLGFLLARTVAILLGFGIIWAVVMDRSVQHLFMDGSNFVLPFFSWSFLLATWGATFWCLRDQQHRCRVCCGELRMPVNSGRWSSLVLDRPRTEYICPYGHGTLYVPGTRLLDIDAVNWTSHDDIWRELFTEPVG